MQQFRARQIFLGKRGDRHPGGGEVHVSGSREWCSVQSGSPWSALPRIYHICIWYKKYLISLAKKAGLMPTCPWSSHPSKITPATSASGFLLQDLRRVGGRAPSSLSKSHLPHCLLGSLTPSERRFRLSPLTAWAEGSEEGRILKTRRRIIVHWAMKRMSKSCAPFFFI